MSEDGRRPRNPARTLFYTTLSREAAEFVEQQAILRGVGEDDVIRQAVDLAMRAVAKQRVKDGSAEHPG